MYNTFANEITGGLSPKRKGTSLYSQITDSEENLSVKTDNHLLPQTVLDLAVSIIAARSASAT